MHQQAATANDARDGVSGDGGRELGIFCSRLEKRFEKKARRTPVYHMHRRGPRGIHWQLYVLLYYNVVI
jgi:hypothetical protein